MRLDSNKSYGVVGGHPSAMYVQNGILFNGAVSGNTPYQYTGILWGWGVANGVPTTEDIAYLWNNGNGILY